MLFSHPLLVGFPNEELPSSPSITFFVGKGIHFDSITCSDSKIECGDRMRQYLSWELWQLVQHSIQQDLFPFTGKFENSDDYFAEQML